MCYFKNLHCSPVSWQCPVNSRKERKGSYFMMRNQSFSPFSFSFLFDLFWAIVPRKLTHQPLSSLIPVPGVTPSCSSRMSQLAFHLGHPLANYLRVLGQGRLLCRVFLPPLASFFFFLNLFRCWRVGPTNRESAGLAYPFSDPLGPSSFWQFSSPICFPLVLV